MTGASIAQTMNILHRIEFAIATRQIYMFVRTEDIIFQHTKLVSAETIGSIKLENIAMIISSKKLR